MQTIDLDASKWKTYGDFYDALLPAIGAPKWHGQNLNALVDSMIWGGINAVEPPYTIKISGAAVLPKAIKDHIETAKRALADARIDYRKLRGGDVGVAIEIEQ